MSNPKIVAYLKPSCGWSRGVRAVFQKYNLTFEDRDIINEPRNYEEMIRKTGQYLQPCVEVDGHMLVDVNGDEVEAYLLEQGYAKPVDLDLNVPTDRGCEDHSEPVYIETAVRG
ncbi:MAG: glutaredoxin [Candidatus Latescibacteria bacterium]|nr:glutaredoxin [Candidatus Latescibacterota bacterium]